MVMIVAAHVDRIFLLQEAACRLICPGWYPPSPAGYRLIDTAAMYRNEESVGEVHGAMVHGHGLASPRGL